MHFLQCNFLQVESEASQNGKGVYALLFIDNSNVWIQAKYELAMERNLKVSDHREG